MKKTNKVNCHMNPSSVVCNLQALIVSLGETVPRWHFPQGPDPREACGDGEQGAPPQTN